MRLVDEEKGRELYMHACMHADTYRSSRICEVRRGPLREADGVAKVWILQRELKIGIGPVRVMLSDSQMRLCFVCCTKGGGGGFRDGKDARIYVDKGYWSRSTAMQGQLTGLGTQED